MEIGTTAGAAGVVGTVGTVGPLSVVGRAGCCPVDALCEPVQPASPAVSRTTATTAHQGKPAMAVYPTTAITARSAGTRTSPFVSCDPAATTEPPLHTGHMPRQYVKTVLRSTSVHQPICRMPPVADEAVGGIRAGSRDWSAGADQPLICTAALQLLSTAPGRYPDADRRGQSGEGRGRESSVTRSPLFAAGS
jgi:hypothetical protein